MKVIITGSTGMVGKGVLLECLNSKHVDKVLVINRSSINIKHPKLREIIHTDFQDFSVIKAELKGYDACFHNMGISSVGLTEDKFTAITYNTTEALAIILYKLNPNMVFNYVSGAGTDSSEKGKVMWARVKGKTENMLLNMGFRDVYVFRPGVILPEKGVKSKTALYNFFYVFLRPFFPLMKLSKHITTSSKLGVAMINSVIYPQVLKHLENIGINILADKKNI